MEEYGILRNWIFKVIYIWIVFKQDYREVWIKCGFESWNMDLKVEFCVIRDDSKSIKNTEWNCTILNHNKTIKIVISLKADPQFHTRSTPLIRV